MAAKAPLEEDPLKMVKLISRNKLDSIFDDYMKEYVSKGVDSHKLQEGQELVLTRTDNLFEEIHEHAGEVGNIIADRVFNNYKRQLNLKSHPENKDDESKNSTSSSSCTEPLHIPATKLHGISKLCPPDLFHKLRIKMAKEIYPVLEKEGRTCLALIICNKDFDYLPQREGAELDILGMEDLLESLGYTVIIYKNLTAKDMETKLRYFAARPEHGFSDSTFLVFMSHGILDGICGTKHRDQQPDILNNDTIFRIFNNYNCYSLKDKPKIIIVQACRGTGSGFVWMTDTGEVSEARRDLLLPCPISCDAVTKAHVEKDFIAFKASTPHNVSWRLSTNGSLFISQLIHCFKEYSWYYHLEDIFRKVQRSFETPGEQTQMPTIERLSMTRYFYLFPGN